MNTDVFFINSLFSGDMYKDALIKLTDMLDTVDNLHIIPCYDKSGKDITEDVRCQFLGSVLKAKPHVGKWLHLPTCRYPDHYSCTICGRGVVMVRPGQYEFCPHCGRRMNGTIEGYGNEQTNDES